jgi:2-polyprenyl-3-methyl-5-hydroxy-6-metoxy-1,4-benzoquinol methylase
MINPWDDKNFATTYATHIQRNDREQHVNFPSMLKLIPNEARSILDFGCCQGYFTKKIASLYPLVEGCDASQVNIQTAKSNYPNIKFFCWDGLVALDTRYNVILAKLVLQFVTDLETVAFHLRHALTEDGTIVLSVPNPVISTLRAGASDYTSQQLYRWEIGDYGLFADMWHRSFSGWLDPFLKHSMTLTGIDEPCKERLNLRLESSR